jgi:hypothetical protein
MTKEEEIYYNNYFELFGSSGWVQLLDELKDREATYDLAYINDERSLYLAKGELGIIRMLLNFEQFIEQGYESAPKEQSTSN